MKKAIILIALVILLPTKAFCWGWITHYHINKEAGNVSDVFNIAGVYPDAFNFGVFWANVAHSPGLVTSEILVYDKSYPYVKSPNFAYILGKVETGKEQKDVADGWGGHIAADWVAHNFLLIPDFSDPNESFKELIVKIGVFLGHVSTEGIVDVYNYHKRGAIPTKFTVRPEHVWKGFVNWKLIEEHEITIKKSQSQREEDVKNGLSKSVYILCQMAQKNPALTCPEEDFLDIKAALSFMNSPTNPNIQPLLVNVVKEHLEKHSRTIFVEQKLIAVSNFFPEAVLALTTGLEALGIEAFIADSENTVAEDWLVDIANCGTPGCARGIPARYDPTKPANMPAKILARTLSGASGADLIPKLNGQEITPDDLFVKFWEDVAERAVQKGAIQTVETEKMDADGKKFIEIDTQLNDEAQLKQAFSEVVNEYAANDNYVVSRYGKWTKRVFLEGQLDPNVILDFDLPTVEILSPAYLDIVNFNPLVISGSATDKNFLSYTLEFGAGENPESFTKICDGTQAVQEGTLCSWDTTTLSGTYTLRLSATDKNDNENVTTAKISIGSPIFISSFGTKGKNTGQFHQPTGLTIDAQDDLYIADTQNDRIQKLDKNFNVFQTIGGKDLFKQPEGVFVDSTGNIYVADTMNHQIKKFDSSGNLLLSLGKKGNANGEFNQPVGIGVSSDNKIYGSDRQNDRIQVFDSTGAFTFTFGTQGKDNGQFNKPQGLFIGFSDNVFVADSLNNRLQMFTKDGQFVFAANHEAFKQPHAVYMDTAINVYIADTFHHRIVKADRFGNPMFLLGTHGKEPSQFNQPQGVSVSSDGSILYVSDTLNNRIQKFQVKLTPTPSQAIAKNTEEKKDDKELSDNDATLASAILTAPNPVRAGDIRFVYKLTGKGKKKAKEGALSIHIEVYTLTGKRIATFSCNAVDETCNWKQALSNGVYVYRLTLSEPGSSPESKIGKIVVVK